MIQHTDLYTTMIITDDMSQDGYTETDSKDFYIEVLDNGKALVRICAGLYFDMANLDELKVALEDAVKLAEAKRIINEESNK